MMPLQFSVVCRAPLSAFETQGRAGTQADLPGIIRPYQLLTDSFDEAQIPSKGTRSGFVVHVSTQTQKGQQRIVSDAFERRLLAAPCNLIFD
jgi:hypothetical protein